MKTSRRSFVRYVGLGGASAALGGCDAAVDLLAQWENPDPDADLRPPRAEEIDDVSHAINRVTWGPRPGDYERVRAMGVDAFIEQQLDPDAIGDRRCAWKVASIESLAEPTGELYEYRPRRLLQDLTRAKLLRAVHSRRQLFEVMVDFWTDHFNIVSEKGHCRWLKAADDRDVIRVHALGGFRSLVRASALSPAMLIYLDGHDNKVEHPGDRPNENYARELLELHTLGVDGGYEQRDVMEVARCFSGWTYVHAPFRFRAADVSFDPGRHDDGPKEVLGHAIPAGGGADDLERVLDIVCVHPSTARNISRRLCRRFIADPAPDVAVEDVSRGFLGSGGDIRATLRAVCDRSVPRIARHPLQAAAALRCLRPARATDASTDCGRPVMEMLERMGHAPYQYPTPDGYPIEATPWLGTLLWRWNLALGLDGRGLKGTRVDADALQASLGGPEALAAHLIGRVPNELERDLLSKTSRPLALMLASPAFQRH